VAATLLASGLSPRSQHNREPGGHRQPSTAEATYYISFPRRPFPAPVDVRSSARVEDERVQSGRVSFMQKPRRSMHWEKTATTRGHCVIFTCPRFVFQTLRSRAIPCTYRLQQAQGWLTYTGVCSTTDFGRECPLPFVSSDYKTSLGVRLILERHSAITLLPAVTVAGVELPDRAAEACKERCVYHLEPAASPPSLPPVTPSPFRPWSAPRSMLWICDGGSTRRTMGCWRMHVA
jgi:hypothetical protein